MEFRTLGTSGAVVSTYAMDPRTYGEQPTQMPADVGVPTVSYLKPLEMLDRFVDEPIGRRHDVMLIASAHHQGGKGPDIRLKRDEDTDEGGQDQRV